MRTADDHCRAHPRALPTTLAFIDRRNEVIERLNREIEAKKRASRKSLIERVLPWYWRRG